ncbi:Serine_threonine-protein kinase PknD [Nocardiopsis dassonvillei]|uniref:protein kinase domain-containing protein n=1 Tax=Nocardiopsis dassonvillei TaxID=2014 RepID=UPI003F56C264
MEPLRPGDPRAFGRYRTLRRIGAGGMGVVFLAVTTEGEADLAAVKSIRPEYAADREFRARFAGEAALARRVRGPYTARVLDADTEGSTPWLATEYIAGPSLQDAVRDGGPFPEASLRVLAAGLAEALAAIHAVDLVHRDLKPSNVLLSPRGPQVIDFGIARAADATALTRTGQALGTPAYMSPEQARGRGLGPHSDLFSYGGVLVFAATGRLPFGTGDPAALLYRVVNEPADLEGVPASLLPLVSACLAKDPRERPSLEAVAAELAGTALPGSGSQDPTVWLPPPVADEVARTLVAATRLHPTAVLRTKVAEESAPPTPEAAEAPDTTVPAPEAQARDAGTPGEPESGTGTAEEANSAASGAAAEREEPSTEVPDTEAPDTEAPDTEAPDTAAPDAGAAAGSETRSSPAEAAVRPRPATGTTAVKASAARQGTSAPEPTTPERGGPAPEETPSEAPGRPAPRRSAAHLSRAAPRRPRLLSTPGRRRGALGAAVLAVGLVAAQYVAAGAGEEGPQNPAAREEEPAPVPGGPTDPAGARVVDTAPVAPPYSFAALSDAGLHLFDSRRGDRVRELTLQDERHDFGGSELAATPSGTVLAARAPRAAGDGVSKVHVWDLAGDERHAVDLPEEMGDGGHIALSADGGTVFVAYHHTRTGRAEVGAYRIRTGARVYTYAVPENERGWFPRVRDLVVTGDGEALVVTLDAGLLVLDPATGEAHPSYDGFRTAPRDLLGPTAVSHSSDAGVVVATATDDSVLVWALDSGAEPREFHPRPTPDDGTEVVIRDVAFTDYGRGVAASGTARGRDQGFLMVWDRGEGNVRAQKWSESEFLSIGSTGGGWLLVSFRPIAEREPHGLAMLEDDLTTNQEYRVRWD